MVADILAWQQSVYMRSVDSVANIVANSRKHYLYATALRRLYEYL